MPLKQMWKYTWKLHVAGWKLYTEVSPGRDPPSLPQLSLVAVSTKDAPDLNFSMWSSNVFWSFYESLQVRAVFLGGRDPNSKYCRAVGAFPSCRAVSVLFILVFIFVFIFTFVFVIVLYLLYWGGVTPVAQLWVPFHPVEPLSLSPQVPTPPTTCLDQP